MVQARHRRQQKTDRNYDRWLPPAEALVDEDGGMALWRWDSKATLIRFLLGSCAAAATKQGRWHQRWKYGDWIFCKTVTAQRAKLAVCE
jgi:hypothetical protein